MFSMSHLKFLLLRNYICYIVLFVRIISPFSVIKKISRWFTMFIEMLLLCYDIKWYKFSHWISHLLLLYNIEKLSFISSVTVADVVFYPCIVPIALPLFTKHHQQQNHVAQREHVYCDVITLYCCCSVVIIIL